MKQKNQKETLRLNIELADNGIIIRNRDCEDDVVLAVESGGIKRDGYGYDVAHSDEYREIGRKVYSWLMDVVVPEYDTELIITNFDIDVVATCKGRAML